MTDKPIPPPIEKEIGTPKQDSVQNGSGENAPIKDEVAWQTKRLVRATWFLGAVTLAVVGIGMWQVSVTRDAVTKQDDALKEQRNTDSQQIARIDAQLLLSRHADSVQWLFDSSQLNLSRDIPERQLRAYVGIIFGEDQSARDTARTQYIIKNTGQTPAFHVESSFRMQILPTNNSYFDPAIVGGRASYATISPGDPYFIAPRFVIADYQKAMLDSRDLSLFMWGIIKYRDVFDIAHYTKFRFRSAPRGSPYEMIADSAGNEAK